MIHTQPSEVTSHLHDKETGHGEINNLPMAVQLIILPSSEEPRVMTR